MRSRIDGYNLKISALSTIEAIGRKPYSVKMRYALILYLFPVLLLPSCLGSQKPAPFNAYGHTPGEGSTGVHIVSSGDTLYTISNRYNIEMRDIAFVNKLQAPFKLSSGQRLRLPPPQEYRVRAGDTLYKVSRLFNTDTSAVARQNNLSPPYKLSAGQVLRMPSLQAAAQPSAPKVHSAQLVQTGSRSVLVGKPMGEGTLSAPASAQRFDPYANSGILVAPISKPDTPSPQADVTVGQLPDTVDAAQVNAPAVLSRPVKISSTPPPRSSGKFLQPVEGKIVSSFGPKADGLHNDGINIAAAKGTPVKAAENGVVVYVGNELKGSGNLVLIRHDGGYFTAYAHMDEFRIERGAKVSRGQTIGTVGSTGTVSSPQLHFELRKGAQAIDPKSHLGA